MSKTVLSTAPRTASRRRDVPSRIWAVLRVMGRGGRALDVPTVAMAANAPETSTADYLRLLVRSGYLSAVLPARGQAGARATYRMVRDTGPHCPRRCITVMRDGNSGEVFDLPPRHVSRRQALGNRSRHDRSAA